MHGDDQQDAPRRGEGVLRTRRARKADNGRHGRHLALVGALERIARPKVGGSSPPGSCWDRIDLRGCAEHANGQSRYGTYDDGALHPPIGPDSGARAGAPRRGPRPRATAARSSASATATAAVAVGCRPATRAATATSPGGAARRGRRRRGRPAGTSRTLPRAGSSMRASGSTANSPRQATPPTIALPRAAPPPPPPTARPPPPRYAPARPSEASGHGQASSASGHAPPPAPPAPARCRARSRTCRRREIGQQRRAEPTPPPPGVEVGQQPARARPPPAARPPPGAHGQPPRMPSCRARATATSRARPATQAAGEQQPAAIGRQRAATASARARAASGRADGRRRPARAQPTASSASPGRAQDLAGHRQQLPRTPAPSAPRPCGCRSRRRAAGRHAQGSSAGRDPAAGSGCRSPGPARRPAGPGARCARSSTSSGRPPTRVTTGGLASAIASIRAMERPSCTDDSANTSMAAMQAGHVLAEAGEDHRVAEAEPFGLPAHVGLERALPDQQEPDVGQASRTSNAARSR